MQGTLQEPTFCFALEQQENAHLSDDDSTLSTGPWSPVIQTWKIVIF